MRLYATTAPPQPLPPPPQNPVWLSLLDGLVLPAVLAISTGVIAWMQSNSEKRRSLEYAALKDDNRETREKFEVALNHLQGELLETRDQLKETASKLSAVGELAASLKVLQQRIDNIHIAHTQDQAQLNQLRTELIQLQVTVEQGYARKDLLFTESMSLQGKIEELGRKLDGRDR